MGGEDPLRAEKSRICPSCRMQISVLAVKCRFCGEEVGKPKEEQRTLSINDLGGESIHHRAPSGSVLEAMEAFRVESGLEADEADRSPGAGDGVSVPGIGPDGMPVLDDDPLGEQSGSGWNSAITSVYESRPPTLQDRIKTGAIIVGGIVLLVFLGVKAPGWIEEWRLSHAGAVAPTYVNLAPGILKDGGPPIKALKASVAAIEYENSALHLSSREKAREKLIEQLEDLIEARPFNRSNLRKASRLITQAMAMSPGNWAGEISAKVRNDNIIYGMNLINIDPETEKATFQAPKPEAPEMHVKQGEVLAERFYVRHVDTLYVTLVDTMRANRIVRFKVGGGPISN